MQLPKGAMVTSLPQTVRASALHTVISNSGVLATTSAARRRCRSDEYVEQGEHAPAARPLQGRARDIFDDQGIPPTAGARARATLTARKYEPDRQNALLERIATSEPRHMRSPRRGLVVTGASTGLTALALVATSTAGSDRALAGVELERDGSGYRVIITDVERDAKDLTEALHAYGFDITLGLLPASPSLVGSIVAGSAAGGTDWIDPWQRGPAGRLQLRGRFPHPRELAEQGDRRARPARTPRREVPDRQLGLRQGRAPRVLLQAWHARGATAPRARSSRHHRAVPAGGHE